MEHLTEIIIAFGYIGIFVTIFAESGFLLGFFLPGDSLLFTVGLFASQGLFDIHLLVLVVVVAAIAGDSFGYYMGNKIGPKIFVREDSFFFKKQYVEKTARFFSEHGKKSIILARFVPIVRTFTPIFAGVGNMEYKTFLTYNILGGIGWGGGILYVSYVLGQRIPGIDRYLELIIMAIIAVSFIPVIYHLGKERRRKS